VEVAETVEDLAAAFDGIVDERGSPKKRIAAAGTPILQPTGERRQTGSHYTPRSLTAPIVKYALEPAFDRLGPDATPEQVLDLKVCDPAMGSGAFLVEACRALGERLVAAWARWPEARPTIPADEEEELHARRLVAQRCLYGVDKNPRAVDLARLSLWLATLARDHEFTFLDHALKCGDSLVGLTTAQVAAANWDESKPGLPLFRQVIKDRVTDALQSRAEIQSAPDDTKRAIQEARHQALEGRQTPIRSMGDAVISAFFTANKPKARENKRAEVEMWLSNSSQGDWEKLKAAAASLRHGENPILPFHWQIEFPEVFVRENGGFDAIVGNPPFLGGRKISSEFGNSYRDWLPETHPNTHGNADLVAHFFRRSFDLLRDHGRFGLIATNTIRQGDTRASGLEPILSSGGSIARATRRLKWPGDAAVVVSVVHISKGATSHPILDQKSVKRISAYLVEGDLDTSPSLLVASAGKAFQGSILLGKGFLFDDVAARKGQASSLEEMKAVIESNPMNGERIFPYLGGDEINNDPRQKHFRYVIDFEDMPERAARVGWPDLIQILENRVRTERAKQKREDLRDRWWQFAYRKGGLYRAIRNGPKRAFALSRHSVQMAVASVPTDMVFADSCVVFAFENFSPFSVLQSRAHEVWARFFSSTLEDRLRYTPSDCFRTFPFPENFEADPALEAVGEAYHAFRAQLMIDCNKGLTQTYNRFHARSENSADIVRLRALHAEMDAAVLRAYGWHDLADRNATKFIEQDVDEGNAASTRFDWPAEFTDEVLARLIALNSERAAAERAAGLTAIAEEDDEEISDDADAE
jgi:hypothetical protein